MITHAQATTIYNDNAFLNFTSMDEVWDRIRNAATYGAYSVQIVFDSFEDKNEVWKTLHEQGFQVERYNGEDDILDVSWGS